MRTLLLTLALMLGLIRGTAAAVEVAGVHFPDTAGLAGQQLVLNGAGERSIPLLKGYAVAMYLPQRQATAQGAISMAGAKRVQVTTLIDAPAKVLADSLVRGVLKNTTEAEAVTLADRLELFTQAFEDLGKTTHGTTIQLDWLPASGTRLSVNGRQVGADIPGEDFYKALLKVWLGERPVTKDLRQALLGQPHPSDPR